ncbi:protein disulfide isomerase Creld1 [Huso huso]|uniref:protein disulfide-isomerase n=1 Tax=Huso huso TaxID=61971 RepID=A0ABR0YML3_HUSHU
MSLSVVPALLWLAALCSLLPPAVTAKRERCETCRLLTDSFNKGIQRTSKKNFGGGNTAWEEEKLAKYERRWEELQTLSLSGVAQEPAQCCNQLLEQIEEHMETWWFKMLQEAPDLFQWLCIETIQVCCPPDTFGADCAACPGQPGSVCGGLGRCDGEGTRSGSGQCVCDPGYQGSLCQDCADGYFREARGNQSQLQGQPSQQAVCTACFHSCKRCTGPEDYKCEECKAGWILHDNKCVDVDECGSELERCPSNTFCFNTDGSYECRGCDKACVGCMGGGPSRCKKCSKGYKMIGAKCLDIDECSLGGLSPCPGLNEECLNEEGGFRCICADGFVRKEKICVENRPPSTPEKGLFEEITDDEVLVLQQMFFGVVICALATLAAKGDMVFTAIFIGGLAAMAGYWLSEKGDRLLEGFLKGR